MLGIHSYIHTNVIQHMQEKNSLQNESLEYFQRIKQKNYMNCGMNLRNEKRMNLNTQRYLIDWNQYYRTIKPKDILGRKMELRRV